MSMWPRVRGGRAVPDRVLDDGLQDEGRHEATPVAGSTWNPSSGDLEAHPLDGEVVIEERQLVAPTARPRAPRSTG